MTIESKRKKKIMKNKMKNNNHILEMKIKIYHKNKRKIMKIMKIKIIHIE